MPYRAPFPLLAQVPAELRDVILDFHFDLERLHALDLPVRTVPTAELAWHLDLPFWSAQAIPFAVTPNTVAARPEVYQRQWQRTHAADLRYPVDAYLRRDGRIVILDGIHRLLKASLTAQTQMRVRVLEPHRFDAIANRRSTGYLDVDDAHRVQ
ncbi:hypothetical protein [Nocardia thraciensis]